MAPPWLGKTTVIVATKWGESCVPPPARAGEGRAISPRCSPTSEPYDVLFIDEIHRLSPVVEEVSIRHGRLPAGYYDWRSCPAARSIKIDLPPFTPDRRHHPRRFAGALLRDRFGIVQRLEFYCDPDLRIHCRRARHMGLEMSDEARWK
ncbi:hypothetical protein MJ579_18565 [Klebsiella pneumoniae]|nr:hypothetical protein MJ579_18565 [Klebsiella pneumoniae]